MTKIDTPAAPGMRLDKWLWCARLYKTRADASQALRAGQVLMGDARIKPSRLAAPGMVLTIRGGALTREITIRALTPRRVAAAGIPGLYVESAESIRRREMHTAQVKRDRALRPRGVGRPTKRDRRRIIRFRRATPEPGADDPAT